MTITVSGLDTFLRIYDASGRSIMTDHNSGSNGVSQVTLEADHGDLFYMEVAAFNGTDTGAYTVSIVQAPDDHAGSPIFASPSRRTSDATTITLDDAGFGAASMEMPSGSISYGNHMEIIWNYRKI